LLVYFNSIRFSEKTVTELGMNNINKNNSSDDYFYSHVNGLWFKRYNWHLFKPLSKDVSHYSKALNLLTSQDNQDEFDGQILALTKILLIY